MKRTNIELARAAKNELAQVIEPLASYVCAADRPRKALLSALALLLDEVNETNRAAVLQLASLRANSLELVA